MLTEAQCRARDGKLTASRVGVLMSGDEAAIYALWREMIGDPDYKPEDLSDVWAVQLGSCTENLNLDWYERRTGRSVTRCGDVVVQSPPCPGPPPPWTAGTRQCPAPSKPSMSTDSAKCRTWLLVTSRRCTGRCW